jgi:hypothetical protein
MLLGDDLEAVLAHIEIGTVGAFLTSCRSLGLVEYKLTYISCATNSGIAQITRRIVDPAVDVSVTLNSDCDTISWRPYLSKLMDRMCH